LSQDKPAALTPYILGCGYARNKLNFICYLVNQGLLC